MYGRKRIEPDDRSKKVCPCTFTFLNDEGVYVTKKLEEQIKCFDVAAEYYTQQKEKFF